MFEHPHVEPNQIPERIRATGLLRTYKCEWPACWQTAPGNLFYRGWNVCRACFEAKCPEQPDTQPKPRWVQRALNRELPAQSAMPVSWD